MNSKHPRVLVVGGNSGEWSAEQKPQEARYVNGVEAWVYATNGRYASHQRFHSSQFDNVDIVIVNLNQIADPGRLKHMRYLAENRPSRVQWVTLLEGDMRDYLKPREHLRELFAASTMVNCINRHATAFIQELSSAPVHMIGIPYPVDGVRSQMTPINQRELRAQICPFVLQRWSEYHVARKLNIPISGMERRLTRKARRLLDNYLNYGSAWDKFHQFKSAEKLFTDPPIQMQHEAWFETYYRQCGSAKLWLNLDERYTWGRYVLDAAALGVPIISTLSTGHADILFPETTVATPFDVETAYTLAQRLLNDEQFYARVVEHAQQGIEEYAVDKVTKKLYQALGLES